jgi:hypothetical protein
MKYLVSSLTALWIGVIATLPAQGVNFAFANVNKGKEVLLGDQAFYDHLSPAEIAIRMGSESTDKSVEDLKALYDKSVEEWSIPDIIKMSKLIAANRPTINEYGHLLPEIIYIVPVTDDVEGGLPHTRGDAIFLSKSQGPLTEALLYHEMFHILTRERPLERDELYGLIGFKPCDLRETPSMVSSRLTNPDVPLVAYYVEAAGAGGNAVIPHLYTAYPSFDPRVENGFSGHFGFGLLRVNADSGVCMPVSSASGGEVYSAPHVVPEFYDAIGRNTGYIIHPEEVLADNFSFLLMGKGDLPNPEIVERLKGWLDARQ